MIRIGIQKKGRLTENSLKFLKSKGIILNSFDKDDLSIKSVDGNYEILFVRSSDIPFYLNKGIFDYGIVGQNVLKEEGYLCEQTVPLGFGACSLFLAIPVNSKIKFLKDIDGLKVATSYPNILKAYLDEKNIQAEIIKINGALELAPKLKIADLICDLVQTGNTLKRNNLKTFRQIMTSEAVFVPGMNPTKCRAKNNLTFEYAANL